MPTQHKKCSAGREHGRAGDAAGHGGVQWPSGLLQQLDEGTPGRG